MRALTILILSLALAGCDSKPKEPPPDILKTQRRAMEKAKGVGEILQQSADERREQADQAK
jgi:outer membrane PBP1 activator LpoA protein